MVAQIAEIRGSTSENSEFDVRPTPYIVYDNSVNSGTTDCSAILERRTQQLEVMSAIVASYTGAWWATWSNHTPIFVPSFEKPAMSVPETESEALVLFSPNSTHRVQMRFHLSSDQPPDDSDHPPLEFESERDIPILFRSSDTQTARFSFRLRTNEESE